MRRSSSLLSRLALALLALMGFVAPLATVEADRVVQTDGGRPSPGVALEQVQPAAPALLAAPWPPGSPFPGHEVRASRRYLLHRAWLI